MTHRTILSAAAVLVVLSGVAGALRTNWKH